MDVAVLSGRTNSERGLTMSAQSDQFFQDMSYSIETTEPPLTSTERAIRWIMVIGFVSIIVLEGWLLWQVWTFWA
jgi:hypothetical protein